ncbi:MAG: D-mannonate oxidoreductase [Ignavibacteria bacterium RBG_13_36_8]|nr:MAG: D-mannonate oxidoreductase [Ignavibacteria bacterium RBG_13_36_8]
MEYLANIFNLREKVAVLTGGAGVLAGKMAEGFLKAGVKVVLLDINENNLNNKVESLNENEGEIIGIRCDVLDEKNIESVKQKILKKFQRIDILVNAAGGHVSGAVIGLDQNVFDIKIEQFNKVMELNLNGTVLPALVFGKVMAQQKKGSIINISSMATQRAISRAVGYSAAKSGVENFTRWMAVELSRNFGNGIRVNAIAPGFLLTNQNKELLTNEDGSLTERGKTIINMTPFKRFGEPEELVGAVLWLASDASKFVTGAIIPIDGGFSSYSGV